MKRSSGIFFIVFALFFACSTQVIGQISVHIGIAPPPIPVYEQPLCPGEGYLWVPGYWAYDDGYYWVPGYWMEPPEVDFLWTPGYWAFEEGYYGWHPGYWGPEVGFYGGIDYGYGYGGEGYHGGYWRGHRFIYNTAVSHVNTKVIHNTYSSNEGVSHVHPGGAAFNGHGGVTVQPNSAQVNAMHVNHVQATAVQQSHQTTASRDKAQFASHNNGRPANAAMVTPHGAPAPHPANNAPTAHPANTNHGNVAPAPGQHTAAPDMHRAPQQGNQPRPAPAPRHVAPPNNSRPVPQHMAPQNAPHPQPQRSEPHNAPRPAQQMQQHNMPHNNPAPAPRPMPQQRPHMEPAHNQPAPAPRPEPHGGPRPR